MRVDHAGQLQQALFGFASELGVSTDDVHQALLLHRCLGIGTQPPQRLLQCACLALAPGLGELCLLLLLSALLTEPDQRGSGAEPDQAGCEATEQWLEGETAALAAGVGRVQKA